MHRCRYPETLVFHDKKSFNSSRFTPTAPHVSLLATRPTRSTCLRAEERRALSRQRFKTLITCCLLASERHTFHGTIDN